MGGVHIHTYIHTSIHPSIHPSICTYTRTILTEAPRRSRREVRNLAQRQHSAHAWGKILWWWWWWYTSGTLRVHGRPRCGGGGGGGGSGGGGYACIRHSCLSNQSLIVHVGMCTSWLFFCGGYGCEFHQGRKQQKSNRFFFLSLGVHAPCP
jgi:hypothetical protein